MLISTWLTAVRDRLQTSRSVKRRSGQKPSAQSLENLETRALLTSPTLVSIRPNVGDILLEGETRTVAPRELTLQFNPGQQIDASTLRNGIFVERGGADRNLSTLGDNVPVTIGFVGIGDRPEEVVVRFAENLPDDVYRITILGAGLNRVENIGNDPFNNGVDLSRNFRLNLGAVVEGVVPQPVLRDKLINIASVANLRDGDRVTVVVGGVRRVFEFNSTGGIRATSNVAVNFTATQSATTVATSLRDAIATVPFGATVTRTGTIVRLVGNAFTPTITRTATIPAAISISDGGLVQRRNMVIVHFNNDTLNTASAQDPTFYRLINTATTATTTDDRLYVPSSVVYSAVNNTAVLTFASNLPIGTFALRIGSNSEQETLAGAIGIGTILGNTFSTNAFLGGALGTNDVDLYKFNMSAVGTLNVSARPVAGHDVVVRLFNSARVEVFSAKGNGPGVTEALNGISLLAGTYYIGVSSAGNDAYTAGTSSSSAGGTTTGAYTLTVQGVTAFVPDDLNSSFGTATNLGTLGAATQNANGQIQPQSTLLPPSAGGNDEPGHRDIPAESHIGSSGTTPVASDGIRVVNYYFGTNYGFDPQGNVLYNGITDNQKQRAREIFEIWSKRTGIVARETSNFGIQIITGDLRAFEPLMPPNAAAGLASGGFAIMNGNIDWGTSEYGGGWFNVALHEIGHSIGLDHAYDLISVMGEGEDPTQAVTPREPIFPTDHDIVHLQRIERPDANDIDMYQFQLPASGKFSAEVIAERQVSNLDSVLRLYDQNYKLIAQNDNYYSGDSFIGMNLPAGTYYIGLSSTGNDTYNPTIADTGANGTTDGAYQLKLQFTADATNKMVDAPLAGGGSASEFDGDADGNAGGEYEFFFQVASVANTIFVDKAAGSGDGSIASPYNNISLALLNANSGSIVRIVGNGGTDGNELTASDALPYVVGIDPDGLVHADGGTLEVPQGVTLMIDADAVIKLQSANLDAGTSAQGIDRSNGAIQILGLPGRPVYLTSYLNDTLGGDSNGVSPAAAGGNWGGVVFRDDSDYEAQGIFLNYVNKANITFGGGQVDVNSVPEVFTPIHLVSARPTITFNTITNSSKSAMSANPNSFEESAGRVGPEIHGNSLTNNSLNGMFVRVKTSLGKPVDTLDVQARFDDDDIVHIVTENIVINGNPGGPLDIVARLSGRLAIDAGMIIKLGGSRIESTIGNANLIAEGTSERPVIFTSTLDDQFGIGGTFDSTNNRSTRGAAAGDWGGLVFNATSMGSIDHAIIRYGGGKTPIEGDFNEFNVIEIHQADVRIANSRLEFNDSGTGPSGSSSGRNGRGANAPATIFVRGAQPIIVNNEFRDNNASNSALDSFIISIDVNSLNSFERLDRGRSTGLIERYSALDDNTGPLISQNRMRNNDMNGMQVRGGILTTQVVLDDTDIVHILQSEVYVPNHHTFSGVRLQSRPTESLVVKLLGANAGFTAGGVELDINDRIGGTVQVIGSPGFPVVMTSLNDDSVGAGFDLDGFPVLDTNNDGNATTEARGDWRSVKLEQYSNDRNVRVVVETEKALTSGQETLTPQLIGTLAPNEKSGDDNRPVGFEIHGHISPDNASDVDTYSFKATAGSEIWLDLDRTSSSLDSVLELVSAAGSVLARSDAGVLSFLALPMQKAAALGGDHYTFNRMDEGFRVILPGAVGAEGTYFVRVRSSQGKTSGAYQLQVRVNQRDEIPGSTVRFADIRFASNGIEMYGLPGHSPLSGEAGEAATGNDGNNSIAGAEFIGDLLSSDQNTISVSGNLSAASDVDFFSFSVDYQFIQAIAGVSNGGKSWATIFDIDYADGLTRPDTILSVYDAAGRLIFVSRDSDILDDQPAPGTGTGLDDLTRGSVGKLDAFLGTVALPEANGMRYHVAVSSNGRMPAALQQTFEANAADPLARLEPINSIQRIVEDHIGFQGYSSAITAAGANPIQKPILPDSGLFDITTATKLDTYVKPFTLADVSIFTATNGGGALLTANPFTGAITTGIANGIAALGDIAVRPDGVLFGFLNNSGGALRQIDLSDGSYSGGGNTGIPVIGGGQDIAAMAFRRTPEITTGSYELYGANNSDWDQDGNAANNNELGPVLWRMNPSTGGVIDEDPNVAGLQPLGALPAGVSIQGLAFDNQSSSTLYAVDNNGTLWRTNVTGNTSSRSIDTWTQVAANIPGLLTGFTNLTLGPQNVEDARYSQMLFATGTNGKLYAFNQNGVLQRIFDTDDNGVADSSSTDFGITNELGIPVASPGLAFSPLDFNLWHPTLRRRSDLGHGINTAPDNSRIPGLMPQEIRNRLTSEAEGGASFYFGLEQWEQNPGNANAYYQYSGSQGQFGVLNAAHQRELTNNPSIANTYNMLGGAYGSLITNSFSLEGYKATDRPTLYFNYFLATDDSNFGDDRMRDAARVYASDDGGLTWQMVATNNSIRNRTDSELPAYSSHSATQTPADGRQLIQELFDNTGGWRQARIDLGGFGGSAEVKLRFDFSTSGEVNDASVDSLGYGTVGNRDRSRDNSREGFYVDDIIVGIANRGEMATTSGANLGGAFYSAPADPSLITQHLSGEYQLEIRRGTEFGSTDDPLTPTFTVGTPFRGTDRFVSEYTLTMPTADVIQSGESYTISDGIISRTFVFNPVGALPAGSIAVTVLPNATKGAVASALTSAINGVSGFNVVATTRPSSVNSDAVDLTGAMNVTANPIAAPANLIVNIVAATVGEEAPNTVFTVTRTGSPVGDLPVTIFLTDVATGLASVNGVITDGTTPGTTIMVVIPSGSATVVLPLQLDPTPNAVYDGSRAVRINATAVGLNSISDIIDITNNEAVPVGVTPFGTLGLTLLQLSVPEDAGTRAVTGYVTLPASATDIDPYDGTGALVVTLTSSDGSEIRSTTTDFIDGTWRAFFAMEVLDEFFASETSTVTIFATAPGFNSSSATIDVTESDNVRFVDRLGDKNLHRQQGMVVIESNTIRDFSGYGVISDAAVRAAGNQTGPGSVRNLATLNALRLIPGVTIRNNIIANLGTGGILFSGDTNTNAVAQAPVPFGKIVNNTIYGGSPRNGQTQFGVGIQVEQNASPTLLNNIVANTVQGIVIDGSSSSTVVGTTLFQNNGNNGTQGSDFIDLATTDPLFVRPAVNNFYPAPGSLAVDSSLNSLADRPAFTAVKNPLGIPVSDVVAPDFDLYGQKRLDDDSQDPPPGLGSDIFKDRGAVERADFVGPFASFVGPAEDNNNGDLDSQLTRIHVDNLIFPTTFSIDLLDSGIGVDDSQVRSSQFQLRQNGVLLVENVDYRWRYNPNNNRVFFISVTTFPVDTRYSISINNTASTGIRDLAGNRLRANQLDGSTVFTLLLTDGVNDAPVNTVPGTQTIAEDTTLVFSAANNNAITITDRDAYLGRPESNPNFTAADGILDVTLAATNGKLTLGRTTRLAFISGEPGTSVTSVRFTGTVADITAALEGLSFVPTKNYFNSSATQLITITSRDLGNFGPFPTTPKTTVTRIRVRVTPVNDKPTSNPITDRTVNEDAVASPAFVTIPGFITGMSAGPANESTQLLRTRVTIVSENSAWTTSSFFSSRPVIVRTADPTVGDLRFRTRPNVNGEITIRVEVLDNAGGVSVARTFKLTVLELNDRPVFTLRPSVVDPTDSTKIRTIVTEEDQSLVNINVPLILSSAAGPATALDELASQGLTWRQVSFSRLSGNLVFDVLQVQPNGVLEYRPRLNTAGEAELTIQLLDSGSNAPPGNFNSADLVTFRIKITEVNDIPVARTVNYVIDEGYSVLLDARASFDVDEVPFSDTQFYSWDLNNDGMFETDAGTSPTLTVTWAQLVALGIDAPSLNTIKLKVTDSGRSGASVASGFSKASDPLSSIATATLRTLIVDYGDASNSYGTLKSSNGAAHTISNGLFLGSRPDSEINGVPGASATGDNSNGVNDEDGVKFPVTIEAAPGSALESYIDVTASRAGKLDIWLDLNRNGMFNHATEHLNGGVSYSVVAGVNRIFFNVPAGSVAGPSMMRFRVSTAGLLLPTGRATNGEVEDYAVKILTPQQAVTPVITRPIDFNSADGLRPVTTDSTPTIKWTLDPKSYSYDVIVTNSSNNQFFRVTGLQVDSATVSTSLPAGIYTATVVARNKSGAAAPLANYEFEVAKLVVSSPSGDIRTSRPTITWNHVPGSTTYTVQINSLTTGVTLLTRTFAAGTTDPATFVVPNNLALGRYRVRIRATDAENLAGDWGPYKAFRVRTAPVINGPASVVTNTARPTINWSAVTGATNYTLVLFNLTDNVAVQTVTGIPTTSWVSTSDLPVGRFRAVVTAFNSANESSFASTTKIFRLAPIPTVVNPFGRLDDATPTFAWNPVLGADLYELIVRRDFGNFGIVYQQKTLPGNVTQHTMPTPLPLGRYTYEVRALNKAALAAEPDAYSSRSLVTTFTVAESPVITGPPSSTFLARPAFTWNNPPLSNAAAQSDIRVSIKEGADFRVVLNQRVTGMSFTPSADLAIGAYKVEVRTYSTLDPGQVSEWSVARNFRVTTAPVIIGPSGRTADATPSLNWSGVLGGQTYQVIVTSLSKNVVAYNVTGINALNYTIPFDLPIGRYRFTVQARTAFGELSDLSLPKDFQIVAAPTVTGPSSSTFNRTPSFAWNDMSGIVGGVMGGATSYDFALDFIPAAGQADVAYPVITGLRNTDYTVTRTLPLGLYRATVRARSADVIGDFSTVLEFYVGGNPVVNAIGTTTDRTPTISWRPVDGASGYNIFIALDSSPDVAVAQQSGIGSTSYTAPFVLAKGTYRVWIQAVNGANGQLSGPALSGDPSIVFTIADASDVQKNDRTQNYTVTSVPMDLFGMVSESTISMLPSVIFGSPHAEMVIADQAVDAELQISSEGVVETAEANAEAVTETIPQTDEILARWDEQKWWDAVPAALAPVVTAPAVSPVKVEEKPEELSASAGLLGAIMALAPWALRRRRKDDSST